MPDVTPFVFVQPFGLSSPGGGARILRSLVEDAPLACRSICISPEAPPDTILARDVHVPSRPSFGSIESTRLRGGLDYVGNRLFARRAFRRLRKIFQEWRPPAVHLVAHTDDFLPAFAAATELKIPVTVAIHDDFEFHLRPKWRLSGAYRHLEEVWTNAARRIVICEELGAYYSKRFAAAPYEVVTDSLIAIPSQPSSIANEGFFTTYFMGAVHLSYLPNFRDLLVALKSIKFVGGSKVTAVLRGGGIDVPQGGLVPEFRSWATEVEVAEDFREARLLYFPLPFEDQYDSFVKYSLSTKLVSYLGSGLPILYHGPRDSAAGQLLESAGAAIMVCRPGVKALSEALTSLSDSKLIELAHAALRLARRSFRAEVVRARFWEPYLSDSYL